MQVNIALVGARYFYIAFYGKLPKRIKKTLEYADKYRWLFNNEIEKVEGK